MYSSRIILNETEPGEDPGFFLGGCAPPGADYSAPGNTKEWTSN